MRFRVGSAWPERDHFEERVVGSHGGVAAAIEEEDLGDFVLLEAAELVELDDDVGGKAMGVPVLVLGLVGVGCRRRQEFVPEIVETIASAPVAAVASKSTTVTAVRATTTTTSGGRGEGGGEGAEVEEESGGGGGGEGFEEGFEGRRGFEGFRVLRRGRGNVTLNGAF